MKTADWVTILTSLAVILPVIVGGVIKIITAIDRAHSTAAKAVAAAEAAAETVLALQQQVAPPSNGVPAGAVTENTNVALHYFVDMLAAVLKVPAPTIPTPTQTANKEIGATLDSLPVTTNPPRTIPNTLTDPPEAPSGS